MNNSQNKGGFDEIKHLLSKSLQSLIEAGIRNGGHWGNTRGTADSLIAINRCLINNPYPILKKHAYKFIIKQAKTDENAKNAWNWEEEVWDSSVAIMALSNEFMNKRYREKILSGWVWLENKYNRINNNWHDEPWETSWALLAFHSIMENEKMESNVVNWEQSLLWLSDLCGKPQKGLLINWHYSALFILIVNRYANGKYLSGNKNDDLKNKLRNCRKEIISYIIDNLIENKDGNTLWTQELWSNSLVLWALCEPYQDKYEEIHAHSVETNRIYNWFETALNDNYTPQTEDCAFSCIALFALWNLLLINENKVYEKLKHEIKTNNSLPIEQRNALEVLIDKIKKVLEEKKKNTLREDLLEVIKSDYTPNPEPFTKKQHDGYYTINLRENLTVITLIILAVVILTLISYGLQPYVSEKWGNALVRLPAALGVLATVLKLTNLSPAKLFRFGSKKKTDDD